MELNDLKDSLTALKYGEIATVAMIDRGAYAEIEESIEAESKDQKINSGIFKELAATVKDENEDLVVVGRSDIDQALTPEDFSRFIGQMTKENILFLLNVSIWEQQKLKVFLTA